MQEELGLIEDTMAWLYDEMIFIQHVMAPRIVIQNKSQEVVKILKVTNRAVNHL